MNTDSDFIPEDSDTDSEIETQSNIDAQTIVDIDDSFIDTLDELDAIDVINTIYELFEEYHDTYILSTSSPKFYPDMVQTISEIIYQDLTNGQLCDPEDYDDIYEFIENNLDVYLDFSHFKRRSIPYASTILKTNIDIDSLKTKITALQNIQQPKQKTEEWYKFRYNIISASNLWKALSSNVNINSLIYEKCAPFSMSQSNFGNNMGSAMHWGNKYEPVTVMVYEHMYNTKLGEFGCIQHPRHQYIGASPDGINIDPTNERYGRMVEIKNIVNRDITGIPKEEYWVQTQIQMEVCDLDECDFVETRFLEYANGDAFHEDQTHEYKGVILCFTERVLVNQMAKSNAPVYIYLDVDAPLTKESLDEWIQQQKEIQKSNNMVLFDTQYWYLEEFSCVYIPRNKIWFEDAIPKIHQIWNVILKERVEGYQHRAPKKRVAKNMIDVSINSDLNSYSVKNMPIMNSMCLIKLDEDGNTI
jgi:putative phage-type endonuclease